MGLPFFFSLVLAVCLGRMQPAFLFCLGTRIFQLIGFGSLCPHWLEWFGRFRLFVSCVPLLIL
nr:MAG TPA: hypothetical protein [Caudoviricetes sp.]